MKSNCLPEATIFFALAITLVTSSVSAQPYVISEIMSGLDNPRGLAFGPDGGLYVTEAGRGGTTPTSIVLEGQPRFFGTTSALSRLLGGVQERVLSGLPSLATSSGAAAGGLNDIVFNSSGEAFGVIGLATSPTGRASLSDAGANLGHLVRLPLAGGPLQSITDLAAYEAAQNPDGGQVDSNPFKLLLNPTGGFLATDAGANAALGVTETGDVSMLSVLPPAPEPVAIRPAGLSVRTNRHRHGSGWCVLHRRIDRLSFPPWRRQCLPPRSNNGRAYRRACRFHEHRGSDL